MCECYVSFASALEIQEFVAIATRQYFPIRVEKGSLQADAKSIMSLFSMGFNCPLHVVLPEQADVSAFLTAVRPFVVA